MNEEWKDIPWYEWLYQVSNMGNVRSLNFNNTNEVKNMRMRNDKWYHTLCIKKSPWISKYCLVHRLVASAFLWLDLKDKYTLVCHKNDIKNDNILDNLFLWTHKDNTQDMMKKWRQKTVNRKKVWMYDSLWNLTEFQSLHEAERKTWVLRTSIFRVCNWKRKTSWWYIWKYL